MASGTGKSKTKPLNLFFLNGKLHKRLRISRATDTIETWCYPDARRVAYTYSDVRKNKKPAYSTAEVGEMINRSAQAIKLAVARGFVEEPPIMYTMSTTRHKHAFRWDEESIMRLHAYFLTVHRGAPRKDGKITPHKIPTAREVRAMIRQEQVLYVKNEDGEFVPTWLSGDFN